MEDNNQDSILIIDIPGVARMLLEHYLEEGGYKVCTANSCADALTELRSHQYSLVLLDTFADPQSGVEFITTLRKRFSRAVLPLLLITSLNPSEVETVAFEAGANDFISKPIRPRELLARIATHLDLQHEHHQHFSDLEYCRNTLTAAEEGVWDWDIVAQTIRYSPRFLSLLEPENNVRISNSPQEWLGRIHPDDRERVSEEIKQHLDGITRVFITQHRLVSSENTVRWIIIKGKASFDYDNKPLRLQGTIADISNSLTFDSVTGLSNVHIFCEWLKHMAANHQRSKNSPFALLAIAVDNYAEMRQRMDNSDFNKLLATLATRLHLCLRATDLLARLDIACFGALLTQAHGISTVLKVANRLQNSVGAPIILSGQEYSLNISVGLAFSTTKYDRPEDMIKAAIKAATNSQEGIRQITMADPELAAMMHQRLNQEDRLRLSLEQNQLALTYSPIVDTAYEPHEIFAYQVILNEVSQEKTYKVGDYQQWSSSELAHKVDNWTIEVTLSEALLWRYSESLRHTLICLPVQIQQLTEGRIFDFFEKEMPERYRPHLNRLCLEVSEEVLMQQSEQLAFVARKLQEHDVSLGISKFGLNQTSLRLLTSLPIKYVKLSSNFADTANKHGQLLKLLQAMMRELNVPIIGTSINTSTISNLLKERGVTIQQGRFFADIDEIPLDRSPNYAGINNTPAPQ